MSTNTPQQQAPAAADDNALVRVVTQVLDEQTQGLDGPTCSRLTQARAAAMAARADQHGNPLLRWWRALVPTTALGSGMAAVSLVSVLVLMPMVMLGPQNTDRGFAPVGPPIAGGPVDDLEIVLAGDIEMLEDLEFFEWLATQPVG